MADDGQVLGQNLGDESFPVDWQDGQQDLFWVFDDLHCPNPVSPHVLRHRRLVADVRPHVPPLRDAVRLRLDHQGGQRLRLHRGHPGRPGRARRRRWSTTTATCRACRWIRPTPGRSAPYLFAVLPHYAGNFLDWWRERLLPEIERNFAYLDGFDTRVGGPRGARRAARGRHRRPRPALEDPLDAQLRPVLGHPGAERDHRRRARRGRPGAARAAPELASTIATGTRSRRCGR